MCPDNQLEPDTQSRLLDAAEELMALNGYHATSLRAITQKASVNLAAVNYHFSSKEKLFEAVCVRRISEINQERLQRLDDLENQDTSPALGKILEAFLAPAVKLKNSDKGRYFMKLMSRIYTEPGDYWTPIFQHFEEVKRRYFSALSTALPQLDQATLMWRVYFMIGAMCQVITDDDRIEFIADGKCDPTRTDEVLKQLVAFMTAGFNAPSETRL